MTMFVLIYAIRLSMMEISQCPRRIDGRPSNILRKSDMARTMDYDATFVDLGRLIAPIWFSIELKKHFLCGMNNIIVISMLNCSNY